MNQLITGKFIAQKRKEKNLTQEQLAEKLGVSNKTVSKWETGKCLPDYSVMKALCGELGVTVAELMNGEEAKEKNDAHNDEQMMDMLKRVQELENQKNVTSGMMLIMLGLVLQLLSYNFEGSPVKDFFSGLMLGLSVGIVIVGVFVVGKSMRNK